MFRGMRDFTSMLQSASAGDRSSAEALLPLVYDELRKLAHARMAREMASHTLQPTALVHEAWLRLVKDADRDWKDRSYFFAAASTAMRRILVEHARRKAQLKRGGDFKRVDLDDFELAESAPDEVVLRLDDVLKSLEKAHPQWAQVVEMKYFGGMTNDEVADAMKMSRATVARYWAAARLWMCERLHAQTR